MDSSEDDIQWESDEKDAEEVQEEYNDPHEDNLTEAKVIEMLAEMPSFPFPCLVSSYIKIAKRNAIDAKNLLVKKVISIYMLSRSILR